ncbi:MAG: twin-arginine translocation signal domain-containing protein, partial [Akkermansia sp.]
MISPPGFPKKSRSHSSIIHAYHNLTPQPPFLRNDVPHDHPAFLPEEEREMSRRSFMKWMGAGAALMGLALPACRRVEKYLVPYNEGPE